MSNKAAVDAASFKKGIAEEQMVESSLECSSRDEASPAAAEKHLLQSTWCMYLITQAKDSSGNKWVPKKIFEFDTVEDFWCMVNNINSPSRMGQVDLALFKRGVEPLWEDPAFTTARGGGRWTAKADPRSRAVDEIWVNTMLGLISSESLDNEVAVGATISCRKFHVKTSLWIKTQDEQEAKAIGHKFQDVIASVCAQPSESELAFDAFHNHDNLPWKQRTLLRPQQTR